MFMCLRDSNAERESGDELEFLSNKLNALKIDNEKRIINILLIGETGVGKSTFINTFFNYLRYPTLKDARKGRFVILIPATFTTTDQNYEERVIHMVENTNGLVEIDASTTQLFPSYVCTIEDNLQIRLIDTPGIDNQNNINTDNIVSCIREIKQQFAVCILLNPNSSRLTSKFQLFIKQLLPKIHNQSQNLIFVFTNTRSTFHRPGETISVFKKLISTIDNVCIPFDKKNIFCIDNEGFRFIAAVNNGILFSSTDIDHFSHTWSKSVEECWRLITYITEHFSKTGNLTCQNAIAVNEACCFILRLSKPLADVTQLVIDNIHALEYHKNSLNQDNKSLSEVRAKLYIPFVNIKSTPQDQPTTVCTSPRCSKMYLVCGKQKWHYSQRCHDPCYLKNVPREVVGTHELKHCDAMNSSAVCMRCHCVYKVHMHIYYQTKTYEDRIIDESLDAIITDKNRALKETEKLIKKITTRINEYKQEKKVLIEISAKFAYFLEANDTASSRDATQADLEYFVDRERTRGDMADPQAIQQFQQTLTEYTEAKNRLKRDISDAQSITVDDIKDNVKMLRNLNHSGKKIKEMFEMQKYGNLSDVEARIYIDLWKTLAGQEKKDTKTQNDNDVKIWYSVEPSTSRVDRVAPYI